MRKLPFFIGLGIMFIQAVIAIGVFISTSNIPEDIFNFWMMFMFLVITNIASIGLVIYGLVSRE